MESLPRPGRHIVILTTEVRRIDIEKRMATIITPDAFKAVQVLDVRQAHSFMSPIDVFFHAIGSELGCPIRAHTKDLALRFSSKATALKIIPAGRALDVCEQRRVGLL